MSNTTHNIILLPEWYQRGFAFAIQKMWFGNQAHIFGLQYLRNNMRDIKSYVSKHGFKNTNIVFFDSIYHPLYKCIGELASMFENTHITRIQTHTFDTHLQQPIRGFTINHTIDLTTQINDSVCFPRDPNVWDTTTKLRKKGGVSQNPKVFPMLVGNGMKDDLRYLKKVCKYPFNHINQFWDNQVIDCIKKFGIVGIAAHTLQDHTLVRKFWHTYGAIVLEDADNGLTLPSDAQVISFLTLLESKSSLRMSKRTNIDFSVDYDNAQSQWESTLQSLRPNELIPYLNSEDLLLDIHKNQLQCIRLNAISNAKLIKDTETKQATLPLINIPEDKLPTVSICTVTRDHRLMFPFVVNSILHQSYPLDKIEWVVLQNGEQEIADLIPKNLKRKLKRFHMETLPSDHGKTLGELRNIVVSLTNEPFVTFMDDDDIYFHTCLLARIKTLIKYNIDCVGSVSIGNYDLLQEKGSVASDGPHVFSEASMAFRRSFWEERGFSNKEKSGEAHGFLLGRQLNCLSIPYHFNLLALSHSENTTGTLRMIEGKELIPLKKLLTEEELSIVESTSKYLRQRYRVVKVPPKPVGKHKRSH